MTLFLYFKQEFIKDFYVQRLVFWYIALLEIVFDTSFYSLLAQEDLFKKEIDYFLLIWSVDVRSRMSRGETVARQWPGL